MLLLFLFQLADNVLYKYLNHKIAVGPQRGLALVFEKQHWITMQNWAY